MKLAHNALSVLSLSRCYPTSCQLLRSKRISLSSIRRSVPLQEDTTSLLRLRQHTAIFGQMSSSSTTTTQTSATLSSSTNDGTIDEVRKRKQTLRKQVRGYVKKLSDDDVQGQSQRVWERLFALPAYDRAKSVGLFLSMPSGEINTNPALTQVIKDGKALYVPRVGLDFEKCDMDLVLAKHTNNNNNNSGSVSSGSVVDVDVDTTKTITTTQMFYESWPRNKWGIPEPPPPTTTTTTTTEEEEEEERVATPGDIDLLVVPGVAFDKTGARLGQGKGYYDRFISRMRIESKKPMLVAVGLTPQFLSDETVPTAEYDFQMDVVLTPEATYVIPT